MSHTPLSPGRWEDGQLPSNVAVGPNTLIRGTWSFKRFYAGRADALRIGAHCTMESVQFAVGPEGRLAIGDFCYFDCAVLLCELEMRIGSYVAIGWNTTIADSDFHPIAPAQRIADAIACSPLGKGKLRPRIPCEPVIIGDDVWIGPAVTILKGVRIGDGSYLEAGSLVTGDIPPRSRAMGNPARVVGTV